VHWAVRKIGEMLVWFCIIGWEHRGLARAEFRRLVMLVRFCIIGQGHRVGQNGIQYTLYVTVYLEVSCKELRTYTSYLKRSWQTRNVLHKMHTAHHHQT
jgi:hypothetical protein